MNGAIVTAIVNVLVQVLPALVPTMAAEIEKLVTEFQSKQPPSK